MSKKKSFMNTKNIISEDIFSAFFRGLFTGKGSSSKEEIGAKLKAREKKFRKDIKKDVDSMNKIFDRMAKEINQSRIKRGAKPIPKAPKITVDDVVNDAKAGKF